MKLTKKISVVVALAVLSASSIALTNYVNKNWVIDKAHSAVSFEVRHFFTPVTGEFNDYEAEVKFDPENLQESSIDVLINVNSIDTKNEKRDNHLQSPDFFNAEKWPHITFISDDIEKTGENEFVAHGKLTIKDVEKDFDLPFTLLGMQDNPMRENTIVAGFTSTTKLSRNDYNVGTGNWASDAVVGDEVTITLNLEMNSTK